MNELFTVDEALGRDALFGRDEVADVKAPTVTIRISCIHPGCKAAGQVEVDANKPTPDGIPLWRQLGWLETPAGAICPDHRYLYRASRRRAAAANDKGARLL